MNNLPLSICQHVVDPNGIEYDFDIIHLGIPNREGRIYTLSDAEVLKGAATLYLRYACHPGTTRVNYELTKPLGDICDLRIVGGTIRGTFVPSELNRAEFDRLVRIMRGKITLGLISEIDVTGAGGLYYANIRRIVGAQVLMEDGRSLSDTTVPSHELLSLLERR